MELRASPGQSLTVIPVIDSLELAELADRLLQTSGEDEARLAVLLDSLDPDTRAALLDSDLLNALQAFFFFFREVPPALVQDRLLLHAARDAASGILIGEEKDLETVFLTRNGTPVIEIREADTVLASFEGHPAYRAARAWLTGDTRSR